MHTQLHPKRSHLIGWTIVAAAPVLGEVVSYEATSFPEDEDPRWEYTPSCNPERWIDDGWLSQHVEVDCGGPPGGDRDRYITELKDFAGQQAFFFQWRIETDGDRSEIPGTAPSDFVTADLFGVSYHFTIARDQVRLIRDNLLPIVFVDVEAHVPHTYRLELFGKDLYVWYIDGQVVDSGVPEGAYPTPTAVLTWRARAWYLDSTTQWDYIRFGTIPVEGSGDFDSEGDVDLRDFYFFDECLTNGGPGVDAGPGCLWADMDQDGDVDFHDLGLFQLAFTGSE